MQSNLIVWIKLYFKCLSVNGVTGDFWFDTDEKWGGRGDRESQEENKRNLSTSIQSAS